MSRLQSDVLGPSSRHVAHPSGHLAFVEQLLQACMSIPEMPSLLHTQLHSNLTPDNAGLKLVKPICVCRCPKRWHNTVLEALLRPRPALRRRRHQLPLPAIRQQALSQHHARESKQCHILGRVPCREGAIRHCHRRWWAHHGAADVRLHVFSTLILSPEARLLSFVHLGSTFGSRR